MGAARSPAKGGVCYERRRPRPRLCRQHCNNSVTGALHRWNAGDPAALGAVRAEVTDYLRDEIHDIERAVRNEIRPADGADAEQPDETGKQGD
jgi:hypothetical protein